MSLKQVVVAGALLIGANAAMAAVPGPVTSANTGNGAVLVATWDGTRSVVQWISQVGSGVGETYLNIGVDDLTTAGPAAITRDYGTLDLFSGYANPANVQYAIFSADSLSAGIQGAGIITTQAAGGVEASDAFNGGFLNQLGDGFAAAAFSVRDYINLMNGQLGCNGANPCVATSPSVNTYWNQAAYGTDFNTGLGLGTNTNAASVGSALEMWYFESTGTDGTGVFQRYAVGDRVGQWLLDNTGHLTYTFPGDTAPVPLPAAVWLLLSGLTGMGVVGRRKNKPTEA
jgi:hypothetical protein